MSKFETSFRILEETGAELNLYVPFTLVGSFVAAGVDVGRDDDIMLPASLLEDSPEQFRREGEYVVVQDVRELMAALGGKRGLAIEDVPETGRMAGVLARVLTDEDRCSARVRRHAITISGKHMGIWYEYARTTLEATHWVERKMHRVRD